MSMKTKPKKNKETPMKKIKTKVQEERVPLEPKEQRFPAEEMEEDEQVIETAAYKVGLSRGLDSRPKDESIQWVEAEKMANEELD